MKRILAVVGACLGLSACVVNDGYGYYDDYDTYGNRYYSSAPSTRVYYSDYYGYRRPYVNNYYYTQDGRRYDRNRYDRNDRRYHRDDRRANNDNRRPSRDARPGRDDRPSINQPNRPNRADRPYVQRPDRSSGRDTWWNDRGSRSTDFGNSTGGRSNDDSR